MTIDGEELWQEHDYVEFVKGIEKSGVPWTKMRPYYNYLIEKDEPFVLKGIKDNTMSDQQVWLYVYKAVRGAQLLNELDRRQGKLEA
jgi:hypothetical protein